LSSDVLFLLLFCHQKMPKTFREAFDGKQGVLERKLQTQYGLLAALQDRGVIMECHRTAVEVTWLAVCNGLCGLCIV